MNIEIYVTDKRPTSFQRYNLAKLALFLKAMGSNNDGFCMYSFFYAEKDSYQTDVRHPHLCIEHYHECGTSACAVGYGPLAGIDPIPPEVWNEYASRCFLSHLGPGDPYENSEGFNDYNKAFDFLFGVFNPDSPILAAKRIAYYLMNNAFWCGNASYDFQKIYELQEEFLDNNPPDWSLLEKIVAAGHDSVTEKRKVELSFRKRSDIQTQTITI